MTLKQKIEDYVGSFSDTDALDNWLTTGAKMIIDLIPESEFEKYAKEVAITNSGISTTDKRVHNVLRELRECRKITAGLEAALTDTNSIHRATDFTPCYITKNALLRVFPVIGSGAAGSVSIEDDSGNIVVNIPSGTQGSGYKSGFVDITFSGGTLKVGASHATGTATVSSAGKVTAVTVTSGANNYTVAPTITITSTQAKALAVSYPTVSNSDTSITDFPDKMVQIVVLYVVTQAKIYILNTILKDLLGNLNIISVAPPSSPIAPAFTFDDITINSSSYTPASFSSPDYTPASLSSFSYSAIADFGTAPVYNEPTLSLTASIDEIVGYSGTIPTAPEDLDISISPPIPPADATYSYSNASLGTYTSPDIDEIGNIPPFITPTNSVDLSYITTYIRTDEDLEKASVEINAQQMKLTEYEKAVQAELAKLNANVEKAKMEFQGAIEKARLEQESIISKANKETDLNVINAAKKVELDIQMYTTKIQKYIQEMQAYATRINAEVSLHQGKIQSYATKIQSIKILVDKAVEEYKTRLELFQTKRQTELNKYQGDIQNQLNQFNAGVVEYQAKIQKAIKQAELEQQAVITYGQMQAQNAMQNAKNEIDTLMQNAIKSSDIDAINKAKDMEVSIINNAKAMEAAIFNESKEMERQIAEYSAKLNLFQSEVAIYQAKVQEEIQRVSTMIQKYLGQHQATMTELQAIKNEYTELLKIMRLI